MVALARLCWQDMRLVSALVRDLSVNPHTVELTSLGMHHADRLDGCMDFMWGVSWKCQICSSTLLVKMQKVLPPCCVKNTLCRGWDCVVCAVDKLWSLSQVQGTVPKRESLCFHWFVLESMGCSSVTVCYVCECLTQFECRLSFVVRHSSGGRVQTQCVASLLLGHVSSAPAPCIIQHSLAFELDKSAGSQSQGRGHQDVTRPPHLLESMWQIFMVEKESPSPFLVLIMENNAGCFAKYL